MKTQEIRLILGAKLGELSSCGNGREERAIQNIAEEMDALQQQGDRILALDTLTRNPESSTLVSEALRRIESHTYGICAECDEAISPKRIAALPWAKYCIRCQENIDRSTSRLRFEDAA